MIQEILQYSLPLLIGMGFSYLMMRLFMKREKDKQKMKIKQNQADTSLRLQLQAMERLILYLERIHPLNITNEVYKQGMNVAQLQLEVIRQINKEYFHNLTQQLYIDSKVWQAARDAKEETLALINGSLDDLEPGMNAKAFIHQVAASIASHDGMLPTEEAIHNIQISAQKLLNP